MVGAYRLRFAKSAEDLGAIFRLRFLVFNLELGEGLQSAYRDGHDIDELDSTCDHLIAEHTVQVGKWSALIVFRRAALRHGTWDTIARVNLIFLPTSAFGILSLNSVELAFIADIDRLRFCHSCGAESRTMRLSGTRAI
jgi:hypothetical protein